MPNEYTKYGTYANQAATRNGIDPALFAGLIDAESNWNPTAQPRNRDGSLQSSAFGFGQLLKGTAGDLGVDRYNPYQNLDGSAKYFGGLQKRFGTQGALMHYYGSNDPNANLAYANNVAKHASKYGWQNTAKNIASGNESPLQAGLAAIGVHSSALDTATQVASDGMKAFATGGTSLLSGGDSGLSSLFSTTDENGCGPLDFICKLQAWILKGGFFQRFALAILAFIILLAAFLMIKPVQDVAKTAALAA